MESRGRKYKAQVEIINKIGKRDWYLQLAVTELAVFSKLESALTEKLITVLLKTVY